MKTRNGFVSNSSSSSFIIASKSGITKEKILTMFDVGKGSMLFPLAEQMAALLINECQPLEEAYEDVRDIPQEAKELTADGYTVFTCECYDDADVAELVLCDMKFDNRGSGAEIIIFKERY